MSSLDKLANLNKLEQLYIAQTNVASLEPLESVYRLTENPSGNSFIVCNKTEVTSDAIKDFKDKYPKCVIR